MKSLNKDDYFISKKLKSAKDKPESDVSNPIPIRISCRNCRRSLILKSMAVISPGMFMIAGEL